MLVFRMKRREGMRVEKSGGLKRFASMIIGAVCGVLNGLFGAGGGIAAVPLLKWSCIPLKKAHATSLAVILPISIVSAVLYLMNGTIQFTDALPYLPGGFIGAILGAMLMQKIPDKLLRKAFGAFMIYAAVRLLFR